MNTTVSRMIAKGKDAQPAGSFAGRRMRLFAILAAIVAGLFVAWALFLAPPTSRFRLTIEVATPDGVKSGSSVFETKSWESTWGPHEARGVRSEARGEAVFVDLGQGRNLIATFAFGPYGLDKHPIFGLTSAALAPGRRVPWKDEPKLQGKGELPADHIPLLITFDDINDPKTVRLAKPGELERVFGPGYRFLRAVVERTDDPPTYELKKKLPWLSGFKGVFGGDLRLPPDWTRPERYLTGNDLIKGAG